MSITTDITLTNQSLFDSGSEHSFHHKWLGPVKPTQENLVGTRIPGSEPICNMYMWVATNGVTPIAGWFIVENPLKVDCIRIQLELLHVYE